MGVTMGGGLAPVTRFRDLAAILAGIPHTPPDLGRKLYDFVRAFRPARILELGFAHGVSTCYLAGGLAANGKGSLLTYDLDVARERSPNIDELLRRTGLARYVERVYSPSSYTWRLLELVEKADSAFDFCFIDGAHTWETDGLAFFLVDRLLSPGGWILFDDLHWTFANSPTLARTERVAAMPPDERETAQVGKVFDVLVRNHRGYTDFSVDGSWGWARKVGG